MKEIESLSSEEIRIARMLRALGNPARLRIVLELAQRASCVTGELVGCLPLAPSTVSEHLRVLKEAELVVGSIEHPSCYCLDREALGRVARFLAGLAHEGSNAERALVPERR